MRYLNDNHWSVYMHVNKVNGKIYIGQTGQSPKKRWDNGRGYKGCEKMWNAIQKYGWDNFEHKVLYENLSKENADIIERALIIKYDTIKNGYNIQSGGSSGERTSEETKEKLRERNKEQFANKKHRKNHMDACGYKYVLCIGKKKIFPSAQVAADYFGFP